MLVNFINPIAHESLEGFIRFLLSYAIGTSILLAIVALIISGFKYMFAMGDEDKIKGATNSLLFALLGLVLVFIAPILVEYIITSVLQ